MLTSQELTQARADVAETLVSDVAIQRVTITTDSDGFTAESWATTSTVKGRIDNLSRASVSDVIAQQETGRVFYQLTVAYDADLRDGDRVAIGGVTFEVKTANLSQDYRIVRRGVVVKVS